MARLTESETVVSQLIYERLGLLPSRPHNSTGNPLLSWDLTCSVDALSLIASQQDGNLNKSGWQILGGKKSREIHEQLLKAFSVFEYWPSSFYSFLDQLKSPNKRSKTETGLGANLGTFYRRLGRLPGATLVAQLLGKEFENYLLRSWDRGYLKKIKCISTAGKYISMTKAARILRMHYYLLDQLVSSGKIRAIVRKTGHRRLFLVEAADVEKLRLERAQYLSLERASRLLGVCQLNLLRLVEPSLILPTESPTSDIQSTWKFDKDLLSGFVTKLFSKTNGSRNTPRPDLQTFSSALNLLTKKLSSSGWGIQTLIEDIFHDKLVPRERSLDRIGVASLNFSRQEVKAYLKRNLRVKTKKHLDLILDFKDLGLKPQLIYFLVKKGLIKTKNATRKGSAVINRDAIVRFESEFIFAKDLARSLGTSVGFLINGLQKANVIPVSGKKIDFGPQYIFRSADLDRLNLEKFIKRILRQCAHPSNLVNAKQAAERVMLESWV